MMKKIFFIIILFSITLSVFSQKKDNYNRLVDSLLNLISQRIESELFKDSIKASARPWKGFGDSYILETKLDENFSLILSCFNPSDTSRYRFFNQPKRYELKKRVKRINFMNYIRVKNELPYKSLKSITYKFLLLARKEENFRDALYGEFEFEFLDKELVLIKKRLELLKGEENILKKHHQSL